MKLNLFYEKKKASIEQKGEESEIRNMESIEKSIAQ